MLKPNPSKPKVGANALRSLLVAERKRGRNERERRPENTPRTERDAKPL